MSQAVTKGEPVPGRSVPYDIIAFGVLMILSGMVDTYIIIANPDYRLPFFGTRLSGFVGRFILFLFPIIHFIVGYGLIRVRRWAFWLFIAFSFYGIISPTINFFRLPPPHNIRTALLIGSFIVLGYLYLRRKHFKS